VVQEGDVRLAALCALCAALVAVAASPGRGADECRGLMACIPVAGPWVVVPAKEGVSRAVWQLECPARAVVAGLDARVSEPGLGVVFSGRLGSPVNPGITTTTSVLFTGTFAGTRPRATSFRPFIGCIRGGGQRTPTGLAAAPAALVPGEPVTTRVKTIRVRNGELARATHGCQKGERLLNAGYAVGVYSGETPLQGRLDAVRVVQVVRGGRILVSATRSGIPPRVRAEVQVHAECAR
jgi:hypothetical protein